MEEEEQEEESDPKSMPANKADQTKSNTWHDSSRGINKLAQFVGPYSVLKKPKT